MISQNIQRRHLDQSQRAMIASRIAVLQNGDEAHGPRRSLNDIAKLFNIGESIIKDAALVAFWKVRKFAPL